MGISRLAPVRLGDALEVESHTEGQHGETLVVSGRFRVNSLPVFSATSGLVNLTPYWRSESW